MVGGVECRWLRNTTEGDDGEVAQLPGISWHGPKHGSGVVNVASPKCFLYGAAHATVGCSYHRSRSNRQNIKFLPTRVNQCGTSEVYDIF